LMHLLFFFLLLLSFLTKQQITSFDLSHFLRYERKKKRGKKWRTDKQVAVIIDLTRSEKQPSVCLFQWTRLVYVVCVWLERRGRKRKIITGFDRREKKMSLVRAKAWLNSSPILFFLFFFLDYRWMNFFFFFFYFLR
jgi:hypothetical protein